MAGLVPAIHVDPRDKPGDDEIGSDRGVTDFRLTASRTALEFGLPFHQDFDDFRHIQDFTIVQLNFQPKVDANWTSVY
jgi:hypothetical protein